MSQTFAERLGWIPKSEELRMSMGRALTLAQERNHAEVTLEHFLLALTEDSNAGAVFDACQVNLDQLRNELNGYVSNELGHLVALGEGVAQPSEGFKKVMAHASAAAEQSQREYIDGAIVLAALIGEAQSQAAQILQSYGLTFEVAVNSLKNANASQVPNRREQEAAQYNGQQNFEHEQSQGSQNSSQTPTPYPYPTQDGAGQDNQWQEHYSPQQEQSPVEAPDSSASRNIFDQSAYSEKQEDVSSNSDYQYPQDNPAEARDFAQEAPREEPQKEQKRDSLQSRIDSEATVEDILASVREIIGVDGESLTEVADDVEQAASPVNQPTQEPRQQAFGGNQPGQKREPEKKEQVEASPFEIKDDREVGDFQSAENLATNWPDPKKEFSAPEKKEEPIQAEKQRAQEQRPEQPQNMPPPSAREIKDRRQSSQPQKPEQSPPPPHRNMPPPAPTREGQQKQQKPQNQQWQSPPPQYPQHPPQGSNVPPQRPTQQGRGGPPPYPGAGGPPPQNKPPMHRQMGQGEQQRSAAPRPKQEMTKGQLIENIPRKMKIHKPVRVEVRLAKEEVRDIERGIVGNAPVGRHEVMVTEAMSVRLFAPNGGFKIEQGAPETQWIDSRLAAQGENYGAWIWNVTPTTLGKKPLQLSISARIVGEKGVVAQTPLPEQIVRVNVRVNYARTLKHVAGWTIVAAAGGVVGRYSEKILELLNISG